MCFFITAGFASRMRAMMVLKSSSMTTGAKLDFFAPGLAPSCAAAMHPTSVTQARGRTALAALIARIILYVLSCALCWLVEDPRGGGPWGWMYIPGKCSIPALPLAYRTYSESGAQVQPPGQNGPRAYRQEVEPECPARDAAR